MAGASTAEPRGSVEYCLNIACVAPEIWLQFYQYHPYSYPKHHSHFVLMGSINPGRYSVKIKRLTSVSLAQKCRQPHISRRQLT